LIHFLIIFIYLFVRKNRVCPYWTWIPWKPNVDVLVVSKQIQIQSET
jgi:hypothetical protein